MNTNEREKVQAYLRAKFGTKGLIVRAGSGKDAPDEVMIDNEFIGVVYRNVDEGEVSYDFTMSILEMDLD